MGTSGAAVVVTLLFGRKTKIVTQNAMLKSTSVSDFWGRRWNQLVHGALKVWAELSISFEKYTQTVLLSLNMFVFLTTAWSIQTTGHEAIF